MGPGASPYAEGVAVLMIVVVSTMLAADPVDKQREKILIRSSLDGTEQPCAVILPKDFDASGDPAPLLVSLHTWSSDLGQRHPKLEQGAWQRGWIYLFPNFRGVNRSPDACGSIKAQQDVIDAVDWAIEQFPIDTRRIYLTGVSGGGHMAMLLAGRYPQRWTAVSAWVGISDLAAWHAKHRETNYGEMLRQCCGGPPGHSPEVDEEYRIRSPKTWLAGAVGVPLDLAAGVHDGHTGSVPIRHTLEAFNVVARARGATEISEEEINQLSRAEARLDRPHSSDTCDDPTYGRAILLRRTAGKCRATIFEGGHERLDEAALEWLGQHVKP